jgi:hypothetical protein
LVSFLFPISSPTASNSQPEAKALAHGFANASIAGLDIADTESLDKLVSGADVVIRYVNRPAYISLGM